MVIADTALARRLEREDARAVADCVEAYGREMPEVPVALLSIAGGSAGFAGVGNFLTQAKGLGMDGPVEEAELERLDEFFRSRGSAAQVTICPMADDSLLALGRRGYRLLEYETILVASPSSVPQPAVLGVETYEVGIEERAAWSETCARGFIPEDEAALLSLPAFRAMAGLPVVTTFLARVGGEIAGAGAVGIRDGLAGFFATSVLPSFRGRGVQRALIAARIEAARRAGCDLYSVAARPGSASQRNFQRSGFQPVYTKPVLIREWE